MDRLFDFIEDHPLLAFAGGLAIQAVIFVAAVLFVLLAVRAIFF